MKFGVELAGNARNVEVTREEGRLRIHLDGKPLAFDAVKVAEGIFSILIDGEAFEVRVADGIQAMRIFVRGREMPAKVRDPRQWQRRRGGALEAEGRQQILAPMPGKVVRLLVRAGEAVEAGQGLLVVEAMKMQNEIRTPKSGTVEQLYVAEGQAVNAGEVVASVA